MLTIHSYVDMDVEQLKFVRIKIYKLNEFVIQSNKYY